eukprot:jgi/Tetstr1/446674/TSEL_003613.t1
MLLVGYVLLAPSAGESCVGAPQWGNCTSGNEGFRNPALDVVDAERLDANSAGLIMDGHLRDWEEHGGSRRDKVMDHLKLNKNGKFKCKEKARKAEVAKRSFVASMEGDEIRRAYLAENPNLMP